MSRRQLTRRVRHAARLAARSITDPASRDEFSRKARSRIPTSVHSIRNFRGRGPGTSALNGLVRFPVPDGPIERPHLRVAAILDPFSELAFKYEWDQHRVPRNGWREAFEADAPDLLFVESAWVGNDRAWRLTMTKKSGPHQDLVEVVQWCKDREIPTVFWNKEDPPNYDIFVATAALFDHVFTVDADRIEQYRIDLGHQNVRLLPFAAQPRIHTPVSLIDHNAREAAQRTVAFAGTYFTGKHSERREQMDFLLPPAQARGLHIFSRMQAEDERYQFPARYQSCVVGSLPYPEMLSAFRAYPVFLNVNSVIASPTMCARRLFELSAAQTAVLSGPAAAIEPFFGDTITVVNSRGEAESALNVLLDQKEHRDRLALRAHRRVFDEHLYRHRVDTILDAVGLVGPAHRESISAVVPTMRPQNVDRVLALLGAQIHPKVELVFITHGFAIDTADLLRRAQAVGLAQVVTREAPREWTLGACMNLGVEVASGDYVAKMDDDNTYSPHYLSDLVRAFAYSEAQVVGKWAHYVHLGASNAIALRFAHAEHRYTKLVQGGTLITPRELARSLKFEDLPRRVDTTFLEKVRAQGGRIYSADRFNYVSRRAATTIGHTWGIADEDLLNRGSTIVGYGDGTDLVTV